jgi:SAM-dependent methyltransferase
MGKKYYEYYEEIYAAVLAAGGEGFNPSPEGRFDDLFKRSLLPPFGQVLDLGCGEGHYARLFASQGYPVLGIDVSASAIALAGNHTARMNLTNVQFSVGDVTNLANLSDESFDVILSIHCYHCLSDAGDRRAHLQECWRVLRPGGIFVFENMAAPLERDLPAFRTWHAQKDAQLTEDASGVTTCTQAVRPFPHRVKPSGTVVEIPAGIAMAHRFYSRLPHVVDQLQSLGFEILSAETTVPDPATLTRPELVHGDNILYARRPVGMETPRPGRPPDSSTANPASNEESSA